VPKVIYVISPCPELTRPFTMTGARVPYRQFLGISLEPFGGNGGLERLNVRTEPETILKGMVNKARGICR
jgi:hypothetical protein